MTNTMNLRPFPSALFPSEYALYGDGDYGVIVRYTQGDVSVWFGDEEFVLELAASLAERVDVSSTTPFVCA